MRITLVGTRHEETGALTVASLRALLEDIQPDVIFAESPASHIERWESGRHGTLESLAVAGYRVGRSIEVVPVDLPTPEGSFFRELEELSGYIERTSPAYRRMIDDHAAETHRDGLRYLNSELCARRWAAIVQEEADTVEYIRDPRLREIHDRTLAVMRQRELAMLEHIHEYSSRSTRGRGALLVGAAHRGPIMALIGNQSTQTPRTIQWELDGFLPETN